MFNKPVPDTIESIILKFWRLNDKVFLALFPDTSVSLVVKN